MPEVAHPDLVKVTEIFLVPSSFLVAAVGAADSNPHRAAVSLLGFLVSGLWWLCSREAASEHDALHSTPGKTPPRRRIRILGLLPWLFIGGWLTSLVIHIMLWKRPL